MKQTNYGEEKQPEWIKKTQVISIQKIKTTNIYWKRNKKENRDTYQQEENWWNGIENII